MLQTQEIGQKTNILYSLGKVLGLQVWVRRLRCLESRGLQDRFSGSKAWNLEVVAFGPPGY